MRACIETGVLNEIEEDNRETTGLSYEATPAHYCWPVVVLTIRPR